MTNPTLHPTTELHCGLLRWSWPAPVSALSSAAIGGGRIEPDWLLNIGVQPDFARTDLNVFVEEVAEEVGVDGTGIALLTAVDVTSVQRSECAGVTAHVTTGVSKATWAADPSGGYTQWSPGTINIVVQLPVRLSEGAAVNAVITATEAKSQAMLERGVPGTGTASDAIAIVWPCSASDIADSELVDFAGPRSEWGTRIAQAVHVAVVQGIR